MADDGAFGRRRGRVLIVAGKGGVGKTTLCTALAGAANQCGSSALILAVEAGAGTAWQPLASDSASTGIGSLGPSGPQSGGQGPNRRVAAGQSVFARLAADVALAEYLDSHGLGRLSRRLVRSGVVELAATAAPGIKDVLILGKIRQLSERAKADLIVVDAPASGHALRFLGGPAALGRIVASGPLREQADEAAAMVADPDRCRALLVTVAEETAVNEAIETGFALEDRVGIALDAVVVNGLYPHLGNLDTDGSDLDSPTIGGDEGLQAALDEAAAFRQRRQELQQSQLRRLGDGLPLHQVRLPFLFAGTDAGLDPLVNQLGADPFMAARLRTGDSW